jgi:hypothetical protein
MNYFLRYLKFVREKYPEALNQRAGIIVKVNQNFNTNKDASAIVEFLDNFPLDVPDYPPFETDLKSILAGKLHKFVCEELKLSDYQQLIGNESDEAYQNHFKHSVVQGLLEEMVRIACLELLDERGKLYPPILTLFFKELPLIPDEQKVKFFIASYVNNILVPTITAAWKSTPKYNDEMREKITSKAMCEKIFDSITNTISLKIKQKTQEKNEVKIKYVIDNIRRSTMAVSVIDASQTATLLEAILKQAAAFPVPEEPASFLDFLKSSKPVNFETALKEMLAKFYFSEFKLILDSACQSTAKTIKALLYNCIDQHLADMELYGKPLALGFNHTDYLEYLHSNLSLEAEDSPVDLSNNTPLPFSREMMSSLRDYFHYFIMMANSDLKEVKKNDYFKFFITKIILLTYSQILTNQGYIEIGVLKALAEDDTGITGDELKEFQSNALYNYLKKILITVTVLWLSDPYYQQKFSARNIRLKESFLVDIMGLIEKKLNQGISVRRLKKINGFPTYGNRDLAGNFAISITPSVNSVSIKDAVHAIQGKFLVIAQFKVMLDQFTNQHQFMLEQIEKVQQQIDDVRHKYKLVMESPSQFFKGAKASLNEYDLESEELQRKLDCVENFPAELTTLFQLMEGTFLNASAEDMEGRREHFIQRKAGYVMALEEVRVEAQRLLAEVSKEYAKGKDLQSLQKLHDEMDSFAILEPIEAKRISDLALERKSFYLKRNKIYPRALTNRVGWDYNLAKEIAVLEPSFKAVKKECLAIREICKAIKKSNFTELAGSKDSLIWREQLKACIAIINTHNTILTQNSKTIHDASKPLSILVDGAKANHEEINKMITFILGEPEFWNRQVNSYWGGSSYQIADKTLKFPKRAVPMMKAVKANIAEELELRKKLKNKNKPNADKAELGADIKLGNIIHAYTQTIPGYSWWRSNKTAEFYQIIVSLDQMMQNNFYNNSQLDLIKIKLINFMRNACEPNYQMYTKYQNLNRVPPLPQAAPGILQQISDVATELIDTASNALRR